MPASPQSEERLIGEIDWSATGDGQICCRDGFSATTFTPEQFHLFAEHFCIEARTQVVNDSAVFWELTN